MNAQDYANIVRIVSDTLNLPEITSSLIRNVTVYCKSLNLDRLQKLHPDPIDLSNALAKLYIDFISEKNKESFDYERHLHDANKRNSSYEKSKQMIQPLTEWIGERMPVMSSKSIGVYVDTRVRRVDISEQIGNVSDFRFALVPRESSIKIGDGRIQVRVMPSEVTYFKIGKIILPYSRALRTRNYFNEITLTFTGLRSNGIIGMNDTYHFTFTYTPVINNPDLVELTPVNKYCKFSPPLRLVEDISLRFNDPIYPIPFGIDRMQIASLNYLSTDGRISFTSNHGLADNDVIIVLGLRTLNDSANNEILSRINDPKGIVIKRIDSLIIATEIDFTRIRNPDTNSLPHILIYNRTFRFPLEIGYQDITQFDYSN